ncbi:alpha-L-fucosidase [Pedobacter sp. ok626]|nr:alpha-L-fucosidase [Pedobacter sp. ok626]
MGLLSCDAFSQSISQQTTPGRKTIALPGGKAPASPPGPVLPNWESIRSNYQIPDWYKDGKFGIFLHWGLYSVAAHGSEWYPKRMYSSAEMIKWHTEKFGAPDKFGYKDFIPLLTAAKYNPDDWADLFVKAGAKYIVPTAEHHDGFAMYDSKLTKWDAKDMGPKRDLIGDLAVAVRKRGLKFGVSNHRMENWDFLYSTLVKSDLFDPKYADFYGPPQLPASRAQGHTAGDVLADQTSAPQSKAFLEEWLARCEELVDNYKPDMFWFDNGVNSRNLDSVKLRFASYYYNSAAKWGKQVTISTKSDAFLAGSLKDYERQWNAPFVKTQELWQVDDPIGDKFGYVENMGLLTAETIIHRLVANVSRNGNYLLNISPKADGTIPDDQRKVLLDIGDWFKMNGEAIYGTRAYRRDSDGAVFFTTKAGSLYAISLQWPEEKVLVLPSLPQNIGRVSSVSLLGYSGEIIYKQNDQGLFITLPQIRPGKYAYSFKIEGLNAGIGN